MVRLSCQSFRTFFCGSPCRISTWADRKRGRSGLTGRAGSYAVGYGQHLWILHSGFGHASAQQTSCVPQADIGQSNPTSAFLHLTVQNALVDLCFTETLQRVRIRDRVVQLETAEARLSHLVERHRLRRVERQSAKALQHRRVELQNRVERPSREASGNKRSPPSWPASPTDRPWLMSCRGASQYPESKAVSTSRPSTLPIAANRSLKRKARSVRRPPIVLDNSKLACSAAPSHSPPILESAMQISG